MFIIDNYLQLLEQ